MFYFTSACGVSIHLDSKSAIMIDLRGVCVLEVNVSGGTRHWIFLAMAATVRSLVLPELRTWTTAWLTQAIEIFLLAHWSFQTLSASKIFDISK